MKLSRLTCSPGLLALFTILPLLSDQAAAQTLNSIVGWNRTLLSIVRTPNLQPATIHSTRNFAIMHLAMYEAVRSFNRVGSNTETLQNVAAAAAAHETLVSLYPSAQASLDQTYQASLAAITSTPKIASFIEAIATGTRIADRILRDRMNDGSDVTPPPYPFGTNPGEYESTPPNFPKQPQFLQWANVTPFSLRQAAQFRPGPPPTLDSAVYARDLNEVQTLGATLNSSASAEQMLIGKFWNGSIQNYWNEIAQTATLAAKLNTADTAR